MTPPTTLKTTTPETATLQTLRWIGDADGFLQLIDQTRLPIDLVTLACHTPEDVWQAIKRLSVRGAPAIGIAAAYGVVLALRNDSNAISAARDACRYLATSRPTAVNLFWALDRMGTVIDRLEAEGAATGRDIRQPLLAEAVRIHDQDRQCCHAIGRYGAELLKDCQGVLTHCNAGGLATSEYGTALAAIYEVHRSNPKLKVFADETRPLLQGARLTAWELYQAGIDVTVICDSMAAQVMREGRIDAVIVGADRIAANGDAANKIGTYGLAILAKHHGIPFYVAAPTSTLDLTLASGDAIPIEQRCESEIAEPFGCRTVPLGVQVYNPAFDVTPAALITALVTERGVIRDLAQRGVCLGSESSPIFRS